MPTDPVTANPPSGGRVTGGNAEVAYLVPWGEATAIRFLAQALRSSLAVKSTDKAFTHGGNR